MVRDPEAVKLQISYMPQRFGLYEDLTVNENIRFYADLFGVSRRERDCVRDAAARGLRHGRIRRRLAGKLSGGMKQKLGLVCALIHTPKVLLLDEPTNGVDPVSRREFWAMLYNLVGQGVTIDQFDRLPGRGRAMPSRRLDASWTAAVLRHPWSAQGADARRRGRGRSHR